MSRQIAPEHGYPVSVRVPYADGTLVVTGRTGRAEYEVVDGIASASTRARAQQLLDLGGTVADTNTPPAGSGEEPPASSGDDDS